MSAIEGQASVGHASRLYTYTHGKSTAKVIEDNPRAGIARVIHLRLTIWQERRKWRRRAAEGDDNRRDAGRLRD